jgi:hypothetical protein
MRILLLLLSIVIVLAFAGCQDAIFFPDLTPPAPPRGIATATGDNLVELFWTRNTEPDLYGYKIYVSSSYGGKYEYIGTSRTPYFLDADASNGHTYYYAVTAYDGAGNESDLSTDVAYDTPRPEGLGVRLANYRSVPSLAGYDFSTYSIGPYNDQYTDVYFETFEGVTYLNVSTDTDIQDMGYTRSLYEIGTAPDAGWSPSKDVRVILGHTYVIWTWDDHYAKLRVTQVSSSGVTFDWAYQLQPGNPRLKAVAERAPLRAGEGALSRQ